MIENFDSKQMFTMNAATTWLPLMCFSRVYNLPYSCKYLHLCGESNEWLMYLVFAQLYQIPRYQVISGLEYFNDIGLKQHLEYALHNVISISSKNDKNVVNPLIKKQRHSNKVSNEKRTSVIESSISLAKNLFKKKIISTTSSNSKSGNRKKLRNIASDDDVNDDDDDDSSEFEFDSGATAIVTTNNDYSLDSIDFYELLINCQSANDPVMQLQIESLRWYTPVLSVFATFYPNHDKISCLCSFIYASMNYYIIPSSDDKKNSILFSLSNLKDAIQVAASKSYLRTLLNGLKIFQPKTLLDIYVEFLYNVFVIKRENSGQIYHFYKKKYVEATLTKHQSLIPLEWYDKVINDLTRITIYKSHNIEDLKNLNQILGVNNEYSRLIKLVEIIKCNKTNVNSNDWLNMNETSEQFTQVCFTVIEELLKMQKFGEAEELANFCNLPKSRIHLARFAQQIKLIRLNNDFEEILLFWRNAHTKLLQIGIKNNESIDFLKEQNSQSNLVLERIVLMNLLSQLCPGDEEISINLWRILLFCVNEYKRKNELFQLRDVFKKMLHFDTKLGENASKQLLLINPIKDLLELVNKDGPNLDINKSKSSAKTSKVFNQLINKNDEDSFDILLSNLVDIGKLSQAYVIAKHYKYFNQDLRIILVNL
jgi:hypothetical protein